MESTTRDVVEAMWNEMDNESGLFDDAGVRCA